MSEIHLQLIGLLMNYIIDSTSEDRITPADSDKISIKTAKGTASETLLVFFFLSKSLNSMCLHLPK